MPEPLPRVALLTTSWPRDAADASGRFLANQVERLRAAGVTIDIVAPRGVLEASGMDDPRLGFKDWGIASGGGVVANAMRKPWFVLPMLCSMVFALRRASRGGARVIHANWLLTAPVAAMGGAPVVLTLHGSGTAGRFDDLGLATRHPRIFRWLVRRAAVVAAVSEPLADAAQNAGAHRVEVIPHGVDVPDAPRPAPMGAKPVVLFAGRLSPEKGIAVLVEALDGLDVELVVAGDGPERAHLERIGVEPLGFVDQDRLRELYDSATLLVMPSRSEGFGVVALEAMARGVPVVASRVGGLGRLVEHERTGLLVEPEDPAALRAAISRIADDPDFGRNLGVTGQVVARSSYGWDRVVHAMLDSYRFAAKR